MLWAAVIISLLSQSAATSDFRSSSLTEKEAKQRKSIEAFKRQQGVFLDKREAALKKRNFSVPQSLIEERSRTQLVLSKSLPERVVKSELTSPTPMLVRDVATTLAMFGYNEKRITSSELQGRDPIGSVVRLKSNMMTVLDWSTLADFSGLVRYTGKTNQNLADGLHSTANFQVIEPSKCGATPMSISIRLYTGIDSNGHSLRSTSEPTFSADTDYFIFASTDYYKQYAAENGSATFDQSSDRMLTGPIYRISKDGSLASLVGNPLAMKDYATLKMLLSIFCKDNMK